MTSGGDFGGSTLVKDKVTAAITLSARVSAVVGVAVTFLTRPQGMRWIAFQVLSNGFWIKSGYHPGRSLLEGDIIAAANTITDTAHGFTSGDGPYQLTAAVPAIVGTPGIILSTSPELLTRDAGSWLDEGFAVNQTITLGGSASNNGDLTVTAVTDLVLTVKETITPEGSQTDLTATATVALPTPLDLLTDYYVGVVDEDTYTLHTSQSAAKKGIEAVDLAVPFMTLTTSVVIDDGPPGTLTRTVGSWLDEGFQVGEDFILAGSASNDGTYTPTVVTDLVLTVADTLTSEAAQTDLVISAALPGGVYSIAAMASGAPSATNTNGQEAFRFSSTVGEGGEVAKVLAMPAKLTLRGDDAAAKVVYTYLP